ncbi:protein EMBRYONIC FLOWER 1 [Lactuca sativa]|nr:protein EMBRYONIC FLOWER 1 [Lactuca sativa]
MNSHDEKRIFPVDAEGNNASSVLNSCSSTIKIDSLCIKLGFVKEKGDAEKCSHFSIRGYVSGMRERGSSNFLPFAEALPPMDVPNFKYWLCQSCVHNCGNAKTSHETPVVSVCDQSMIRSCARSFPKQDCGVTVLPFGEGTSGLKSVDNTKDDDDENVLPAFGVDKSQPSQEIPVDNAVPKEPVKISDTNVASEASAGLLCRKESNDRRDDEYQQQDSVVIETITGVVGTPIRSSQQNDQSNGHTRRKARKVRLLKELLCGNNEIQQKEKENSNTELDPEPCNPLPTSSFIKRKVPHDQDQIPVDITTPVNAFKKTKTSKGNAVAVAVAKTTIVDQHFKDQEATESTPNDNRTQKNSNFDKVSSDPVTAWRSIFSDMTKTDNHVTTTATGACKPTSDISKDRGSGPHSNFMAPPHPEKKLNFSMNMSKNPLKSKSFGEELYSRRANVDDCSRPKDLKAHPEKKLNFSIDMSKDPLKSKSFGEELYSRRANVDDCSRPKDGKSEAELGLNLSLNHDPQTLINRPLTNDNHRKDNLFFGDLKSRIHNWIPYDSKSKKGSVHDVSKGHATKQVQQPYTYGSWSGHQKLDFSDPHKRNNGVKGYPDVMRPYNRQRKGPMVMLGRSDETEVVELMAKNQYERNLCEARSSSSNNTFIPNVSGLHNINIHKRMTSSSSSSSSSHQDNLHPSTSEKPNMGPTTMRNQASGFFNQQLFDFNEFDGNWRHNNSRYNCIPIPKKKKKTPPLVSYQLIKPSLTFGYTKCSEKDNEKGIMDLDLNVVAPNVIEEQNSFQSLNPTSSKQHHPKKIHSLDSSYPNETIPAMQLLSLMDAGKSNHQVNNTDERKLPKPLSPCYTHCSSSNMINGKTIPIPNVQFPKPRYLQSSSFPCGFQTGQNVKLTSSQSRGMSSASVFRPQESYVFPVPCHVSEDRSEGVALRDRIEPIGIEICTINKNPADFSTPGPENLYMISVEDLVFRGEKGKSTTENANGPKRQKRS